MLRVTLDTNMVDEEGLARIERASAGLDIEIRPTAVTDWEQRDTPYARPGQPVIEATTPFGVGPYGEGHYGGVPPGRETKPGRFEQILTIITAGSFPPLGSRDALTDARRRQLHDAVIFETHLGDGRDVFVTEDKKGFINHGRREALEAFGPTRIMTVDQFCAWAETSCDPQTSSPPGVNEAEQGETEVTDSA